MRERLLVRPTPGERPAKRTSQKAALRIPDAHVHRGVVVWSAGRSASPLDVWFHPAFGDSHLSYRHVFESELIQHARVFVFDPPGHGASPPRPKGWTIADAWPPPTNF